LKDRDRLRRQERRHNDVSAAMKNPTLFGVLYFIRPVCLMAGMEICRGPSTLRTAPAQRDLAILMFGEGHSASRCV
jgi:hypothetical protein